MQSLRSLLQTIIFTFLVLSAFPSFAAISVKDIVDQNFPEWLLEDEGIPTKGIRMSTYLTADFDRAGHEDYVVAFYSKAGDTAIRIFKLNGDTVSIVYDPKILPMSGTIPKLTLLDLDADGIPEIITDAASGNTGVSVVWIFRKTKTDFSIFGPTEVIYGSLDTALLAPSFIDLNGDGKLEILSGYPGRDVTIYSIVGDKYVSEREVPVFMMFSWNKKETPSTHDFSVAGAAKEYILKARGFFEKEPKDKKGDKEKANLPNEANRSVKAEISLNGVVVVEPKDFKKPFVDIVVPVRLKEQNTISARVLGSSHGRVLVTIEPKEK